LISLVLYLNFGKMSTMGRQSCLLLIANLVLCFFVAVGALSATSVLAEESVEARVREYFADIPVMIAIAKCESGFRQFDSAGNVLDGGAGSMMGVFQIHEHSHHAAADALGLDFHTIEGNLAYARHLYEREGTGPWISAHSCWSREFSDTKPSVAGGAEQLPEQASDSSIASSTASPIITTLTFGMVHPEVRSLQQMLNRAGVIVSESGPGSPGSETNVFGNLTRSAVRRFQCNQAIVCSGDEFTTSFGAVGPRTRLALSEAVGSAVVPEAFALAAINTPNDAGSIAIAGGYSSATLADLQAQIAVLTEQVNALFALMTMLQ
jgi:hypothetical protein